MYYIRFENLDLRTKFIKFLKENEILSVFHYVPLHSSPAGKKYCKTCGDLKVTDNISDTLVRLPMYYNLTDEEMKKIQSVIEKFFKMEF